MQQVEQGKLDLDTDVNKYIDFQVPEAFGKPITLRDVMTHTPGYEDYAKDLIVGDAKMLGSLGAHLQVAPAASHLPAGLDAGLLELRDGDGGLHRGARLRQAVRRLHRSNRSWPARHDALDLQAAAAGGARAVDVEGLQGRLGEGRSPSRSSSRRRPARCPPPARTWRAS